MKIAGKRTGPAEIEALIFETGYVTEVAAIGIPDPIKGAAIVCVCVLRDDSPADDTTARAIASAVTSGLGAPYRPKDIVFCADLPKTRNMKVMRRVIRSAYLGQDPGDLSSLLNPEAVESLQRN